MVKYIFLMILSYLHGSVIASQADSNHLVPSDYVFSLNKLSCTDGFGGYPLVRSTPIDFSLYLDEPEAPNLDRNSIKSVAFACGLVKELHLKKNNSTDDVPLKRRLKKKKSHKH